MAKEVLAQLFSDSQNKKKIMQKSSDSLVVLKRVQNKQKISPVISLQRFVVKSSAKGKCRMSILKLIHTED